MIWQQTLTQAAADLTEPHTITHQMWRWDHNRNRKPAGKKTVHLPGLLEQLYQCVSSSGQMARDLPASVGSTSKPPVRMEALSVHAEISTSVMEWMGRLDQPWRSGGVIPNLQALAYVGWWTEPGAGQELAKDMVRWRDTCLVMTGAEKVFRPRAIPCPACLRYGVLRINLTARAAICRGCRATWHTVAALAAQVSSDLRCVQMAEVSLLPG